MLNLQNNKKTTKIEVLRSTINLTKIDLRFVKLEIIVKYIPQAALK